MQVKNLINSKGNIVKNQFIITDEGIETFQSYDSTIAIRELYGERKVVLDEKYWNFSATTSKYRNQFLGETKKETEAKIKSGEYVLRNLN